MFSTLITVNELRSRIDAKDLVIVDCRFDLQDTSSGGKSYRSGHIPTAVHVDLDRDLSGVPATDYGRHPLPAPEAMTVLFSRLAIDERRQVVVYDANNGIAARFWWMLRYMGHDAVAVLDGGWPAWRDAGGAVTTHSEDPVATRFTPRIRADRLVTLAEVFAFPQLVDAREPARYLGTYEPIDPRAGHIPGACNHYWRWNLNDTGAFLEPRALAERWCLSLGAVPADDSVHYCGSGVTACHNALALVVAGFPLPRVYVGSWSEWCRDGKRPVATG